MISTHATHKGGDVSYDKSGNVTSSISTHATHKGGDILSTSMRVGARYFNSRHP